MKRLCLNFVSFIIIFGLILEVSSRIDDKLTYNAPFFGKYNYRLLVEDDKEGIRHNIPNARYEKWKINSLGFRGECIELEKREGQIRIICLGASETFGLFEDEGKEWPSQLAKLLKNNFPNVEIINASVVGLKPQKTEDYVRKYVLRVKPDVVIVYQGFFGYAAGVNTDDGEKNVRSGAKENVAKRILEEIRSNLRVLPKIKEVVKKSLPKWLLDKIKMWRLEKQVGEIEKIHLRDKKPIDRVPEGNILKFEEDLIDLITYFKENNIIPIISTYPTLVTELNKSNYKQISLDHRRFFIELSEDGLVDASIKFNKAIERVAKDQNLLFIDNNKLIEKTDDYFGDYVHYTNKGAEIIAKNFCRLVNHSGLLKKSN
jgi:lysophospholipase L1-like esterase